MDGTLQLIILIAYGKVVILLLQKRILITQILRHYVLVYRIGVYRRPAHIIYHRL
jgi:hypothetical protein